VTGSETLIGRPNVTATSVEPYIGRQMGYDTDGTEMVLGAPISIKEVPKGYTPIRMNVSRTGIQPLDGGITLFIIILIVVIVLSVAAGFFAAGAFTGMEAEKSRRHLADLALRSMEIDYKEDIDVDQDGIPDVRHIKYKNGDGYNIALSETGKRFLGATHVKWADGVDVDWPDLPDGDKAAGEWYEPFIWVGVAAVAVVVGSLVLFKVILPMYKEHKAKKAPPKKEG
jgi:hypothetical protein